MYGITSLPPTDQTPCCYCVGWDGRTQSWPVEPCNWRQWAYYVALHIWHHMHTVADIYHKYTWSNVVKNNTKYILMNTVELYFHYPSANNMSPLPACDSVIHLYFVVPLGAIWSHDAAAPQVACGADERWDVGLYHTGQPVRGGRITKE